MAGESAQNDAVWPATAEQGEAALTPAQQSARHGHLLGEVHTLQCESHSPAHYATADFREALIKHMHAAKRAAIATARTAPQG